MKPKNLQFPYSWDERKPLLQDRILYVPTYYSDHDVWVKNQKQWALFSNTNPVYVEFCSGNGEWIINQAVSHPHINWIAVEMDFPRVRKIWSKRANRSLENLFIVCGRAQEFAAYYASPDLFSRIFVHFPDPWPRKKHAKHRLFQHDFLLSLQNSLQDNASLHLVTDAKDYIDTSIELIKNLPTWEYFYKSPHFVINREQIGGSWFHRLWQEKGREIFYMTLINKKHHQL